MNDSPLALLGGRPVVTVPGPHFVWPPIEDADRRAVAAQLETAVSIPDRSGVVAELEDALASYLGVRHVVTTCTGTAALHSMYAAAGIGPGDEVIVPALTFHATATPLFHLGAHPVLADVDDRGQLDLEDAAGRVTVRTKAVVAVHLWGVPEDMDALVSFADGHELMLLEDGSHAHGATWNHQVTGTFGTAAAFSLNGPKPLSAGEGGFVATDGTELCYRVLLHGQYNKRCRREIPTDHPLARFATTGMGLKLRIHPLAAALARTQLTRLEDCLTGRRAVADRMCTALDGVPGIRVPDLPAAARPSWYALPLRYEPAETGGLPIERFLDALHAEGATEADVPGSTRPLPGDGPGVISARGVTLAYPGSDRPAVVQVDLDLKRGEVVAVVGENGSGKTTLVHLLTGLYLPDAGEVTWDGVSLAEASPADVWRRVAMTPQEYTRWPLTARENISLGTPSRRGDAAVLEAARAGGADRVLDGLPAGLDTSLARSWWGGHDLSGGQWQRIALARSFHADAGVHILDEPTAALDARAERRVFDRFRELAAGRTALVITHRLADARVADRIVVMADGRIVESGRYRELLARPGGLFAELHRPQDRPAHHWRRHPDLRHQRAGAISSPAGATAWRGQAPPRPMSVLRCRTSPRTSAG